MFHLRYFDVLLTVKLVALIEVRNQRVYAIKADVKAKIAE